MSNFIIILAKITAPIQFFLSGMVFTWVFVHSCRDIRRQNILVSLLGFIIGILSYLIALGIIKY